MREGWEQKQLGDLVQFASGNSFPIQKQGRPSGTYPFFKVSDMNVAGNEIRLTKAVNWITEADRIAMRVRVWPAGTVVFPKVGAALLTEKRRILHANSAFDNNVMGIIAGNELLPEYLLLVMQNVRLGDVAQIGAVPSVNQSHVSAIGISLPPIAEQRRIVDLVGAVDEAIEAAARRIETADVVATEVMAKIVADASLVKTLPIGVLADLDVETQSVEPGTEYPGVGVLNRGRGLLLRDPVTSSTTSYPSLTRLRPGQIVYSKLKAFEGAITVAPSNLGARYCSPEFPTFTCRSMLLPEYFRIFTRQTEFWEQLANRSKGMGGRRERLHPRDFLSMEIPVPSLPAQEQAISLIADLDLILAASAGMKSSLRGTRDSLLSALLSGDHEIPGSYDRLLEEVATA